MAYTKDRQIQITPDIESVDPSNLESTFQSKCTAFQKELFPKPPQSQDPLWEGYTPSTAWNWPNLTQIELAEACSPKISSTTPGPDEITHNIIVKAYQAIPDIFFKLYSKLIKIGYHPKSWKQANIAILPKPGKPDYSKPKAYRLISLLNCLEKVNERIIVKRLSYLAEITHLLYSNQIGGRLKKSAINAIILLNSKIEQNFKNKLKTLALFLNIKEAFNYIIKNRLIQILQNLKLLINLIK